MLAVLMQRSRASWKRKGKNKFGNVPIVVDGLRFDSKLEAEQWQGLVVLERAGEITDLRRQIPFRLDVNGMLICRLIVDFTYVDVATGKMVVADAKGILTPECALKLKLMKAIHGIDVLLVRKK